LLDELAARFQTDMKWSQKALLREIVLSRVYRQSSKASPTLLALDQPIACLRWPAISPDQRATP